MPRSQTFNVTPTLTLYDLKRSVEIQKYNLRADGPESRAKRGIKRTVEQASDKELADAVRKAVTTDSTFDVSVRKVRD